MSFDLRAEGINLILLNSSDGLDADIEIGGVALIGMFKYSLPYLKTFSTTSPPNVVPNKTYRI